MTFGEIDPQHHKFDGCLVPYPGHSLRRGFTPLQRVNQRPVRRRVSLMLEGIRDKCRRYTDAEGQREGCQKKRHSVEFQKAFEQKNLKTTLLFVDFSKAVDSIQKDDGVNTYRLWTLQRNRSSYRDVTLYSHDHYTYTYTRRNIFNTIRKSKDTSSEKHTSHFIERVVCERELETEQRLQHIDAHSYGHNSVSFPFSCAAQPEAWDYSLSGIYSPFQYLLSNCNCSIGVPEGPLCWVLVFSTASYLQLI